MCTYIMYTYILIHVHVRLETLCVYTDLEFGYQEPQDVYSDQCFRVGAPKMSHDLYLPFCRYVHLYMYEHIYVYIYTNKC